MKTKHIVFAGCVLAVLALIAAVVNSYAKNKANSDPATVEELAPKAAGATVTATSSTKAPTALDYNKKLGVGIKSEEVKELQRLYNASANTPKLIVDGDFGTKTLSGVIKVMGFGTLSTTLGAFKAKVEAPAATATSSSFIWGLLGK